MSITRNSSSYNILFRKAKAKKIPSKPIVQLLPKIPNRTDHSGHCRTVTEESKLKNPLSQVSFDLPVHSAKYRSDVDITLFIPLFIPLS
jgi:hypothetical protein